MENEIIINYVSNNCYSIEILDYFLVIDYSQGVLKIPDNKKVIFLVTSKDEKHYTSEILKVDHMRLFTYFLNESISKLKTDDNIIYLRGNNLEMDTIKNLYRSENIKYLSKGSYLEINDDIYIKVLKSKSKGLDVLINIYGIDIYYAGSISLDEDGYECLHNSFIDELKDEYVDIGFFPINNPDYTNNFKRAKHFLDISNPQILFPLNLDKEFKSIKSFRRKYLNESTDIRLIYEKNQKLIINMDMD